MGVVFKKFDAVKATYSDERIALVIVGILLVTLAYNGELAAQYLGQEIAIAARRLQKTGFDALGLLFDMSSMALTSRSFVKTSPCSCTLLRDLTC